MDSFNKFAELVNQQFTAMSKHELFVVGTDNRALERVYIESFPEGSNPVWKSRTEHECSTCNQFIRNLGNVVAIVDGKIQTVWDIGDGDSTYHTVAAAMSKFVNSQPITNLFRSKVNQYGAQTSRQLDGGANVISWNHLYGQVAQRHRSYQPDADTGAFRTTRGVFQRGLETLTPSAIETIIELIEGKQLYRGAEFYPAVVAFQTALGRYNTLSDVGRQLFVWSDTSSAVVFRNTVIGKLAQDLSEGVELEVAVRSFESMVAPTNYKRPATTLVTAKMVEGAIAKLADLGLESAVDRRFANIGDITVNNVLWVNNNSKKQMKSGIAVLLAGDVVAPVKQLKSTDISIDQFMQILPTAKLISLMLTNSNTSNLVSVTAPVDANAGRLFKWDNAFGWSYRGNVADSMIKERVKTAGGNTTSAKLRISLAWHNHDDLDIHVYQPNGSRIYFGNRENKLDVDMNAGHGSTRSPVENISWTTVADGTYHVHVNQYNRREMDNIGFTVEVESSGVISQWSHCKAIARGQNVEVIDVVVTNGVVTSIKPKDKSVTGQQLSQEVWGLKTEQFVDVTTVMYSPNYWDDNAIGNKHWIFTLDNCINDQPARGIYNEFLRGELDQHRKVFELLASKTKCPVVDNQLSGLGFSSTKQDTIIAKVVTDSGTRIYNVKF